jgi:hypothetical protein
MRKVVDNCVGCTSMGLPCKGVSCPNRSQEILCCDKCEVSDETLYHFEGGEYCIDCIKEMLEKVEYD